MDRFEEWLKKRDPMSDIEWPANDFMREAWNAALREAAGAIVAHDDSGDAAAELRQLESPPR